MKRDMDLIRKILLKVEEVLPSSDNDVDTIEGYSDEQFNYHVGLLVQAGYIQALATSGTTETYWSPTSLTWQGHEFLDKARNESVWNKTKALVAEKGGDISFDVLQALLTNVAMKFFGL